MSELETMLAESAGRLFENEVTIADVQTAQAGQWPAALWECLEANGLTRVLVPEDDGGAGASWSEALPVLLAAGKHLVPVPFVETVVTGGVLGRLGLTMPEGPLSLALPQGDVRVAREGGGWTFSGAVSAPWGRFLPHVLVPVRGQGTPGAREVPGARDVPGAPLWLLLPTAGVQAEHGANIAGQARDKLVFDGVHAVAVRQGMPGDPRLIGALQQSIQIAGVLERILNQSVQYANERVQFGKPIGWFQAIQQQLAVLANQVVAARMAVATACAAMDGENLDAPVAGGPGSGDSASRGADWERDAAIAKVICGQAASTVAAIAHQVHGAMGFTCEHTLHFATRRLWSWRAEYGSDGDWAAHVGRQAIARGGDALWPDLTAAG